ncbi:hypothetical protein ACN28S_37710 [Cystobacter fuscus]
MGELGPGNLLDGQCSGFILQLEHVLTDGLWLGAINHDIWWSREGG